MGAPAIWYREITVLYSLERGRLEEVEVPR